MKASTFRKLLSLLLALATVFTVLLAAGCQKEDDKGNDDKNKNDQNSYELKGVNPDEGRDDFIAGLGGVSDTYAGAISEESYESAEEAAEQYVVQEIVGDSYASITSTTSKGELSETEIGLLNLPAEVSEGIVSVEEMEVAYTVDNTYMDVNGSVAVPCGTLDTSRTATVYVIKYESEWKYYAPCPVTGETISKSYYNSVFDNEKYQNCTLSDKIVITVSSAGFVKGGGANESLDGSMTMTMTQNIKHDEGKVLLEQIIEVTTSGIYEGEEDALLGELDGAYTYVIAYMEETVDSYGYPTVSGYIKESRDGDSWIAADLYEVGFSSLEELTPFYDQYLDYSYFTKSNFGFEIKGDNAVQYMEESMSEIMSMLSSEAWDFNMYAEYYVSNGVLSGMRSNAEIAMEMGEEEAKEMEALGVEMEMSMYLTMVETITVTDYGTTVVENPVAE